MKTNMATTSLEAFYSTPTRDWSNKEKQVMGAFTGPDVAYTRQQLSQKGGLDAQI